MYGTIIANIVAIIVKQNCVKRVVLIAFVLCSMIVGAQEKILKIGVKGGVNFSNIDGNVEEIDFKSRSSYHLGALVELRLFQNLSIQPELLYSVQGAKVESGEADVDDVDFKYLTVPVMLKFYLISDRLSLEAGPQFSFLADDNVGDTFRTRSFDLSLGGGLAYDITNNFFVQARYLAGLTEVSKDADLKNTNFQLSVGFKF